MSDIKDRLHSRITGILGFDPADMFGDEWDTDWRVAGKVLELMATDGRYIDIPNCWKYRDKWANGSLPRAINLACVEALQENDV
jgi:hypothetical protein